MLLILIVISTVVFILLFVIITIYFLWYFGSGRPLTEKEKKKYLKFAEETEKGALEKGVILNMKQFILNDNGFPFYVVNFLKYKRDENGNIDKPSKKNDSEYSKAMMLNLIKNGSHPAIILKMQKEGTYKKPLFVENMDESYLDGWDKLAIVRYRNVRSFFKMNESVRKQGIGKKKIDGLEKSIAFPTDCMIDIPNSTLIGLIVLGIIGGITSGLASACYWKEPSGPWATSPCFGNGICLGGGVCECNNNVSFPIDEKKCYNTICDKVVNNRLQPALTSFFGKKNTHQEVCVEVRNDLERVDNMIEAEWNGSLYKDLTFAVDLSIANGYRGLDLLNSTVKTVTLEWLDGLLDMGVTGVKVCIPFPLLQPDFEYPTGEYHSQDFIDFFKWIRNETRNRGMKLFAQEPLVQPDENWTPMVDAVDAYYKSLSASPPLWHSYFEGKKQQAKIIAEEIEPDFFVFTGEISVEYGWMKSYPCCTTYPTDKMYANFVNDTIHTFSAITRQNVKIGAGMGSWDHLEFAEEFCKVPNIDFIDLHIYPVNGDMLSNAINISHLAHEYGKSVVISEAWLTKTTLQEVLTGGAAVVQFFSRDVFDFWVPIDKYFHLIIWKLANAFQYEIITFFFTDYYYSYLPFTNQNYRLTVPQRKLYVAYLAYENMLNRKLTPTGLYYKELIEKNKS